MHVWLTDAPIKMRVAFLHRIWQVFVCTEKENTGNGLYIMDALQYVLVSPLTSTSSHPTDAVNEKYHMVAGVYKKVSYG